MTKSKKDCGCFGRKKVDDPKLIKQVVYCENCSGPLTTLYGKVLPVHQIPIQVTLEQVNAWIAEGYEIKVNS